MTSNGVHKTYAPPSGVWCPAVTLFDKDDNLDLPNQKKYFRYLSETGLAGLVILGTNAEAFLVTRDERYQLIAAAREAVGPSFPLMAGVGAHSTRQVLENIDDAVKAGANYGMQPSQPMFFLADFLKVSIVPRLSVIENDQLGSCHIHVQLGPISESSLIN